MTIDVSLIPQNRVENLISKLSEIENNIGNIGTDITNNLVHKSGNETISGEKTFTSYTHFTSSEPKLVFKSSVMDITQSGWTAGRNSIAWCEDKNGYESGGIYNNISNDDKVVTSLYAISRKSGKQQSSFIRVGVDGLGNAFTEAPHPTTAQDSSNKIATTAWVNNLDNSVVHKAGNETISGDKTFTNPISITTTADEARFITTFTDVSLDTNPTTNIYNGFKSVDSNGVEFANCNCSYNTAGRIGSNFWVNRNDSGTSVSGGMGIYIDKNGTSAYTQAPTPASGDNSTKIATTNWCYDPAKSTNLVHRTGNETINGTKTFNDSNVITNKEFISLTSSPYGQFRAIEGNYGFFIRNDGNATYFLLTNSNDQYGSWNSLRPLTIENASGKVRINNSVVSGFVKETWKSGTSWYRVWSDGWIEQGGRASLNERSSTAYTLHRPFSDTNYFVAASQYNVSTNDDAEMGIGCSPTSTTQFNAFCHYINPNTMNFMWYACGY